SSSPLQTTSTHSMHPFLSYIHILIIMFLSLIPALSSPSPPSSLPFPILIVVFSSPSFQMSSPSDSTDPCLYSSPEYLTPRFILVTGIGTTIALISIIENTFLCFLLLRRYSFRSSPLLYLGLLAGCDIFISLSYIPLMSLNLLADMAESPLLLNAWFNYMTPMITISHIAMTAQSFLIVAATFERYQLTVNPRSSTCFNRRRPFLALAAVGMGILTKFSMAFELQITRNSLCEGTMVENILTLSTLGQHNVYNSIWRFFARTIITVYIPFFILAFFNARIVCVIQKADYIEHLEETGKKRKNRVKEATRTLIFIVCVYLMSNILNVIVTIWEYIDMSSLEQHPGFYLFSVDIVSLLTVVACSLRLPIYLTCQSQLRREIVSFFTHLIKARQERFMDSTIVTNTRMDKEEEEEDDLSSSSDLLSPSPLLNNPIDH
ncbi:hypothetical protein PMAYCL1PPCAC_29418, partial [Pristionchus mayeri]